MAYTGVLKTPARIGLEGSSPSAGTKDYNMATIVINGVRISVEGNDVSISNGIVKVGGKTITEGLSGIVEIRWEGPVANVRSDSSVVVNGDVTGNVAAGSHVSCDNVGGSVAAGSHISCESIGGNASAGSHITRGD